MGAIFGMVGEGSLDEVRAMAAAVPHRGRVIRMWSPAPGVYLGERSHGPRRAEEGLLAADLQFGSPAPVEIERELLRSPFDTLRRLPGQFGFALWDADARALFLATDHLGFKSVHYARLPGRIAFASEYKSLLALPDLKAEPDREAIQYFLATRRFPQGRPFLAGVERVPAGSAVRLAGGAAAAQPYWTPHVLHTRRSGGDHAEAVRNCLLRVVERQCDPFERLGLTLSAGLDSAVLAAAIRAVKPSARLSSYTIGAGNDDPEIQGARIVAEHLGTEHHEMVFSPHMVRSELPLLVWLMEDCGGREEALLQLAVLREAGRLGEAVVMGGHGADALFGGMPRHRLVRLWELFPLLRVPLQEVFSFTQSGVPARTPLGRALCEQAYRGAHYPPPRVVGVNAPSQVPAPESFDSYLAQGVREMVDFGYLEPIHEAALVDFRSPFLDPEFVDLALTIPGRFKVGLRRQKMVLREAAAGLLPRWILHRPKAIQRLRHDTELRRALDDLADELLAPEAVRERGLVDPAYVAALRGRPRHKAYPTEHLYRLWGLVALEIWARQFLDRRGGPWGVSPSTTWAPRSGTDGASAGTVGAGR